MPTHLKEQGLISFLDWIRHAEVEFLGAANTVHKRVDGQLECAMFDGEGMINAIEAVGGIIEESRFNYRLRGCWQCYCA